jgi:hypothetical protein
MSRFNSIYNIKPYYLVLLSLLGYFLLAFFFPLLPHYDRQPVGDIRSFAPGIVEGFLYALLLLVLFVLYWLLYQQTLDNPSLSLKAIIFVCLLFSVPLLFMYPINANDVYRYVIRGLISSHYGLSPFEYAPADFGNALFPLLAGEWYDATSPYGPLWESLAFLVTSIGKENFLVNILMFKVVGLTSLITAGAILWMLVPLHTPQDSAIGNRRPAFTLLWALNPALLLTFVGNAHNDGLMILFLLSGWFIVSLGYRGPGFLLLLAASLFKPIAILAAPVVFLCSLKELNQNRERIIYLIWVFAGGTALLYLSFLPFGDPLPLVLRLLQEATAGASFSPLALIILITRKLNVPASLSGLAQLATAVFVVLYFWVLWRTWKGKSAESGLAVSFWGYIFQALNFRIWYASWPFPWLLLDAITEDGSAIRRLQAGIWFLVTSQLSVVLYGHFRLAFFGGDIFIAHLIGVLFVFFLPFALAQISILDHYEKNGRNSLAKTDSA